MTKKKSIAVFVPRWLYKNDVGITIFVKGLLRSIKNSEEYRLLKIPQSIFYFDSIDQAQSFVKRHNIALVIYHDSRVFPADKKRENGLNYLEACVPFLNPKSVHVADDKIQTKKLLREAGVPVLPDVIIYTKSELINAMRVDEMYVVKPHDAESGRGVKLIKKTDLNFMEYLNSSWRNVQVKDTKYGLEISDSRGIQFLVTISILAIILFCLFFTFSNFIYFVIALWFFAFGLYMLPKIIHDFTYKPLMLEPFFGDGIEEFYCLRCTVIGDKVIESAKKANKRNVTPNISHGGKASKITLTEDQEKMAILASKTVGATYSGVDLLYANGKTVVCEVNVGPIGVYCEQTGVDVGRMLGEFAIKKASKYNVF